MKPNSLEFAAEALERCRQQYLKAEELQDTELMQIAVLVYQWQVITIAHAINPELFPGVRR